MQFDSSIKMVIGPNKRSSGDYAQHDNLPQAFVPDKYCLAVILKPLHIYTLSRILYINIQKGTEVGLR